MKRITRRDFLRDGSIGLAALGVAAAPSCERVTDAGATTTGSTPPTPPTTAPVPSTTDGWIFKPDRRLMYFAPTYGGPKGWADNPGGVKLQWRHEPYEYLNFVLGEMSQAGSKRLMLHNPAGWAQGNRLQVQSHWYTLTEAQRQALTDFMTRRGRFASRPRDLTVGIYLGYPVTDPQVVHDRDSKATDMDNPQHRATTETNLLPFIQRGVYELWFDNSASEKNGHLPLFPKLADWCHGHGVRAGMEAIPLGPTVSGRRTFNAAVSKYPRCASIAFMRRFDPDHQADFSKDQGEAVLLITWNANKESEPTVEELVARVKQGMVLAPGRHRGMKSKVKQAMTLAARR